jgi:hypothetical protein
MQYSTTQSIQVDSPDFGAEQSTFSKQPNKPETRKLAPKLSELATKTYSLLPCPERKLADIISTRLQVAKKLPQHGAANILASSPLSYVMLLYYL